MAKKIQFNKSFSLKTLPFLAFHKIQHVIRVAFGESMMLEQQRNSTQIETCVLVEKKAFQIAIYFSSWTIL